MIKDWHSAAKPEEAVVTHEDLDLKIDFEKKVIEGIDFLSQQFQPQHKMNAGLNCATFKS